jgi:hypothetical protein
MTVLPNDAGGCHFDDGPAECCVPKSPSPAPADCVGAGGVCTSVGGCLDATGYQTTPKTGCPVDASTVCCVPHSYCGDETVDCCSGQTVFSPSCVGGKFVCEAGQMKPKGTCP